MADEYEYPDGVVTEDRPPTTEELAAVERANSIPLQSIDYGGPSVPEYDPSESLAAPLDTEIAP